MTRKRVAILISGRGSNMAALIEAAKAPDYPAEIALVVSNVSDAAGLARAREAGVTTAVLDHKPFGKDRAAFEAALQKILDEHAHRAHLPCRIHAAVHGAIRAALVRTDAQYPSLAAAAVSRTRSARTGDRAPGRKHPARPFTSSSRRPMPGRSSLRKASRCFRATRPTRSLPACSRSSTASIRWRSSASPRVRPSGQRKQNNPRPRGRGLRV